MGIFLLKQEGRCILMSVLSYIVQCHLSSVKKPSKTLLRPVRGYGYFRFLKKNIKILWKEIYSLLLYVRKNRHWNTSSFQGSIVVESAFVFPIFFFCLFFLLQMFSMLQMELIVAEAGIQAARKCAALGYVKKTMQLGEEKNAEEEEIWSLLKDYGSNIVDDITFAAFARNKINDTVAKRASVYSDVKIDCKVENEIGKAVLSYSIQPVIPLVNIHKREVSVYIVYRLWSGLGASLKQEEDVEYESEMETLVYMTEQGTVYHIKRNCTYLEPEVSSLPYYLLAETRNRSGGKYYACDFCAKQVNCTEEQMIYITQYGNRFHISAVCSAIKRNIRTLSEKEAAKVYPVCKKCGGGT